MLHRLLKSPLKVLTLCLIFAFCSLMLNGGWINLYGLYRDQDELNAQMVQLHVSLNELSTKLKRAKDPAFIERQAMDQLDMASDHDLVFVFSE